MSHYLKKNWKITLVVCFFQIVVWGLQAGVQLLLMQEFNAAVQFDFKAFAFWTVINLLAWGLYFALCFALDFFQARAVRTLNNQFRYDLYLSLLDKNHQQYHEQNSGESISWMTNNVKQVEKLAWNPFFNSVGRIAQVIWCMIVLFSLHWSLLFAAIVSTVIMWILPKLFEKRMEQMGKNCADAEAQAVSRLKDLLSGFDVLRCFHKVNRFLSQGKVISDQMEEPNAKLTYTKSGVDCLLGTVSVIIQILSDVLIVFLAFQGKIMPAVLAGGSNLFAGVANGLNQFSNLRLSIAASKPYFEKITVHDTGKIPQESEKTDKIHNNISLENISFSYGERPTLKNTNLQFEIGKKYAITGPSGCGKSTLLKILLGWLPEYSGKVLLDGKDAKNFTAEQLQQQMGYIEQNVFLFNTTIRENITLGEDFSSEQLQKALHDSALIQDLQSMPEGLDTVVGEEGRNLSGGQKQRVAIARALIHNRSILLVDEGTSALDKKNADIVENSLLANPDLTLILISHHLTEERKAQFDRVYRLEPAISSKQEIESC